MPQFFSHKRRLISKTTSYVFFLSLGLLRFLLYSGDMRKLLAHGLLALSPLAWSAVPPYSLHLVDYLQREPLTSAAIYPGQ